MEQVKDLVNGNGITAKQIKMLHYKAKMYGLEHEALSDLAGEYADYGECSVAALTSAQASKMIKDLIRHYEGENGRTGEGRKDEGDEKLRRVMISVVYRLPAKFGWWTVDDTGKKRFLGGVFDEWLCEAPKSPFKGRVLNSLQDAELQKLIGILNKWVEFYSKKTETTNYTDYTN